MSTRSFSNLTHPAQALLTVTLCVVLSSGVLAAKDSRKSDSATMSDPGKQSAAREDRGSRPDSSPGKSDKGRDVIINQPTRSTDYSSGRSDRWNQGSRSSADTRQPDTRSGGGRYGRRYDYPYSQPTETAGKHDKDYRPAPDYRDNRYEDRPSTYQTGRYRDHDYYNPKDTKYPPKTYRPTYRGGFYYYSSRPSYRPCNYGYWVFDNYDSSCCRRSVYYHYGYFPYVDTLRIHIAPYVTVSYYARPVVIDRGGYYTTTRANADLDAALSDIRSAWMDGRSDLLQDRTNPGQMVAVLLDGRYDYSIESDDYMQMTRDAIGQIETISFTWETIRQRTDGNYTAFAKHCYYDANGIKRTVYVSYTLHSIRGEYVITEVGSSTSPLI